MIYLTLLTFFPPGAITHNAAVGLLLNAIQVYLLVYYALYFFKNGLDNGINLFSVPLLLYPVVIFISTLIHHTDLYSGTVDLVNFWGLLFFLEYFFKKDIGRLISCLAKFFSVLAIINYMYLIINHFLLGKSADDSLFITVSNSISIVLIFSIVICVVNSWQNGKTIDARTIIVILCTAHTEILVWSGTGLVGYAIALVILIICIIKRNHIWANPYVLTVSALILFFAITIFREQGFLSYIVEDVLQKDLTFTGRTTIWDFYLLRILESPMLGYGSGYRPYLNLFPHSGYLNIMIMGGAVNAVFLSVAVVACFKRMRKEPNRKINVLIIWTIFAYEIMMLTEMPDILYLVILMYLGYYGSKLDMYNKVLSDIGTTSNIDKSIEKMI
jgi:O-antigen ligase